MTVEASLFRVVYVSRSLLPEPGAEAELERILVRARRGNAALGITGALLFSEDCFAQALEGPAPAVEGVFEAIQCDPRHADVVVLEAAPIPAREFGGWSMAYAGRSRRAEARFAALAGIGADQPATAAGRVLGLLRGVVGRRDDGAHGPAAATVPA